MSKRHKKHRTVSKKPTDMKSPELSCVNVDSSNEDDSNVKCKFCGKRNCSSFRTGVLTAYEIKEFQLINGIESECLKLTSYDLRLGELHYIFGVENKNKWDRKYIGDIKSTTSDEDKQQVEQFGQILTIPKYGSALIGLKETVDTLTVTDSGYFVVGHFDLKLKMVSKGLISQQATQVEPCYRGKLFCHVFNLSSNDVIIPYKKHIASIEFSYVSCLSKCSEQTISEHIQAYQQECKRKYSKEYHEFCDDYGIISTEHFRSGLDEENTLIDNLSLPGLIHSVDDKIKKLDILKEKLETLIHQFTRVFDTIKILISAILAIIGLVAAIVTIYQRFV